MNRHAPQILLLACGILFVQLPAALSAPVCTENAVVGPEAMARTWISAREIARTEWSSAVRSGVGRRYNKWKFAHKRGYMCWASGGQKYCKASAIPCNGRSTSSASFSDKDLPGSANDRFDKKQQGRVRGEGRNDRSYNSDVKDRDEPQEKRLRAKRGYLDKRLADQHSGYQKCVSRSTRISGKVSYGLEKARKSAVSLWSEYVGITQGKGWSAWQHARKRHVTCSPSGSRVKCEVSANACLSTGEVDQGQRAGIHGRRRDKGVSLPVRRPDSDDFAYDKGAQDPGEYGDGNVGDADGKIELPEKKDGFSLPWLVDPPVGRPEPKDGEGGPFGSKENLDDFEIFRLEKEHQGQGSSQDKTGSKRRQGLEAPALPVKRPVYDEMQAMLEQQNNYYTRDDASDQKKQQDRQQAAGKVAAHMSLPQRRPKRNSREPSKAERRFSQNYNTDSDGDEAGSAQERRKKKPAQNWNSDEQQQEQDRKGSERLRNQDDSSKERPRREKSGREKNSFQGRSRDRKNIENSQEGSFGEEQSKSQESFRNRGRSGSRSGRSKQGSSRDQENRDAKKFQGWKVDEEADRTIVRKQGKQLATKLPSWKRGKMKSEKLALAGSKIRYTSNAAVLRNPKTFYGCKEEEVASWGKPQPTKPQARQQAIRSWQKVIYKKYGKNWSDWMKAGSSRVQCGRQKGMRKCVAIASPCGAIMPKKSDAYNSVARCRIYPVSYSGSRSRNLSQAKQNAMNVWEKKIEKKYGVKWSDWFRSMEHSIKCFGKSKGKKRCRATAIPCSA